MVLSNFFAGAIVVLIVGTVVFCIIQALLAYKAYRGRRLVTCPETEKPAAVRINAAKAATDAIFGKTQIRLDQCSRWPERQDCGQACLAEIKADPAQCLVWNKVNAWYQGKSCAYCQKPFGEIHWHDRHPALLAPDHTSLQWNEVPTEKLPEIFATYLPVCWNCYIAETFRRQHPEMVVNRRWEREADGAYVPKQVDALPVPKPTSQN